MTNLFIHEAVKDEDEDALKTVEDGEEISHDDRVSVYVKEAKRPCWTQQHYQYNSTFDP